MQNKTKKLLNISLSSLIISCLSISRNVASCIITHKECTYCKTTIPPSIWKNWMTRFHLWFATHLREVTYCLISSGSLGQIPPLTKALLGLYHPWVSGWGLQA